MAFDGIVTKKVVEELKKIEDYKIDKIMEPDKNTVILGLYGNFKNVALLMCISPNNCRMHLTNHSMQNPEVAPNFCMLLRKHILGYKIAKIYTKALERVIYIDMENRENPDKPIKKQLIVELMGKHSNIILLNENGIIIDALRHTSVEENAQRDIYPTARYFEPTTNKNNLLGIKNFEEFYNIFENFSNQKSNNCDEKQGKNLQPKQNKDLQNNEIYNLSNLAKKIADSFNGISLSNINPIIKDFENEKKQYTTQKLIVHYIYDVLQEILNSKNLSIKITEKKKNVPKDYCLIKESIQNEFGLNESLDSFYYEKEQNEVFINYRNTIFNIILSTLNKYNKRLSNIDSKLEECKDMEKYKLFGELITANLYRIPNYNTDVVKLENYYDDNKLIDIKLDKRYSPQHNAKRFYKKYTKLKNASEIVKKQKYETINEIKYIESIVYELENSEDIEDVDVIFNEISESDIFKDIINRKKNFRKKENKKAKKMTKNKYVKFNPLKYNIDGYTIYVGKNNKENDYLTNKFAGKNDIWLHTKDVHGSHVIIKNNLENKVQTSLENIPENVIFEAASLAVNHSKARNSSNVAVDYCFVQYVKKIPGNKPGLVTYKNNKTIYV